MASATPDGVLYTQAFVGGNNGIIAGVPATVTAFSDPGIGVVASASLPADGSGNLAKNICTMISYSYGDSVAATSRSLVLRDGASGVGTIIWQKRVGPLAAGGDVQESIIIPASQAIPGLTGATAMTLEFLTAPAATGFQSVQISGFLAK